VNGFIVRLRAALVLLSGLLAIAAEPPKAGDDEVKALADEYARLAKPIIHASQDAATEAERERIAEHDLRPLVRRFAGRFIELAGKHAGKPEALAALTWAVTEPEFACPEQDRAIDILTRDFATDPGIAGLCKSIVYSPSPRASAFLTAAWQKNPNAEVRVQGGYFLARYWHEQVKGDATQQAASAHFDKEAEKLFADLAAQHGSVKLTALKPPVTVAEAVEKDLFEIRHLALGRAAPEITGPDADGKAFKLSDYRGRVVLLDFWGQW
jgi:hypothetical protein